jgi:hypothetical protein
MAKEYFSACKLSKCITPMTMQTYQPTAAQVAQPVAAPAPTQSQQPTTNTANVEACNMMVVHGRVVVAAAEKLSSSKSNQ